MIGLCLLSVAGLALIAVSASLLDDPPSEGKPDRETTTPRVHGPSWSSSSWGDALIFLLCLAGILHARKKREDDEE